MATVKTLTGDVLARSLNSYRAIIHAEHFADDQGEAVFILFDEEGEPGTEFMVHPINPDGTRQATADVDGVSP